MNRASLKSKAPSHLACLVEALRAVLFREIMRESGLQEVLDRSVDNMEQPNVMLRGTSRLLENILERLATVRFRAQS